MTEALTVPTLATERLLLRPSRLADAGPVSHYCADPRLAVMTTTIPHPYPPGAADAYLKNAISGRLKEEVWVIDASPIAWSDMVGMISWLPATAALGYWIGIPFWGTGFASEALEALVHHLIAARGVTRLTAEVMADNDASARVLEKAGFTAVETRQVFSVARGVAVPGVLYALDAPGAA